MRRSLCILAASALLGACATTSPPAAPAPPAQGLAPFVGAQAIGALPGAPPERWWRLFDDPVLEAHVQRALTANADLRVALANLESARAAARQADVARWPSPVLESGAGPQRADRQPSTTAVPKTSYELGAAVAFEIDLFGRLRQAAEAAQADAAAAQAARDTAAVTVAADTVGAYLDLCVANTSLVLTRERAATQQSALSAIEEQLKAGEVSPLERVQAGALRDQAAALIPDAEADRRRALFRLATLQGLPPASAATFDASCQTIPRIRTPFPVGDGAALLARRPDIREAEHRLAGAAARAGVARADLYPRVQLGGSGGLIGGGSDAFLTPLITWAFPNQAAIRARIGAADGARQAALANWDRVMLRALEEVETALSDYQARTAKQETLTAAAHASADAARRARIRQRLGADDYLVVVDAERTRNAAAVQALAAEAGVARAQTAIFRALGGGWESAPSGR